MKSLFLSLLILTSSLNSAYFHQSREQLLNFFAQNLSFEEKLGQLLMFNINPQALNNNFIEQLIKVYKIGGFNLIGGYQNKNEVIKIISSLKQINQENSFLPLFLAVDQEGMINRLLFLKEIPQKDLKNQNEAYKESWRRGRDLKNLGFNIIFSPVLDWTDKPLDYIWSRTFQKSKEQSIELALAMIKGYQKAGIFSILKHFPGYTQSAANPHGINYPDMKIENLLPTIAVFQETIRHIQPPNIDGIMVAHLKIEGFNEITTQSSDFLQYAKKTLNYDGLYFTDSIGMKSFLGDDTSYEKAVYQAILSGYQLVILSSNTEVSLKIINYLKNKLSEPDFQKIIDSSFKDILRQKLKLISSS